MVRVSWIFKGGRGFFTIIDSLADAGKRDKFSEKKRDAADKNAMQQL